MYLAVIVMMEEGILLRVLLFLGLYTCKLCFTENI